MRRKMGKLSLAKETLRELGERDLHPLAGGATLACSPSCVCSPNTCGCSATCYISCVYTGCGC